MRDVSAAAPQLVKEAIQVMKVTHAGSSRPPTPTHKSWRTLFSQSIPTVQRQAEGLCQILSTKPSHTTLEIHQDVFAHSGQADACLLPVGRGQRSQRPIRRAVQEEAAAGGYVPPMKKPVSWCRRRRGVAVVSISGATWEAMWCEDWLLSSERPPAAILICFRNTVKSCYNVFMRPWMKYWQPVCLC